MKQRLPQSESAYLNSLSHSQGLTRDRVRDLCASGWSLAAIAEAFDPPKSRSSIRAWSLSTQPPLAHTHPPLPSPPSSSLASVSASIPAAEAFGLPTQTQTETKTKTKFVVRRRVYDANKPKLSPSDKRKISRLAPLARRYRARTSPNGTYAVANRELTETCKNLYYRGASVRELSLAAGVTYRAMARRLGR